MKSKMKPMLPELLFLAAIFVFLFLWAAVQPFDTSPDERMRYDIVKYLVGNSPMAVIRPYGMPTGEFPMHLTPFWLI